VFKDGVITVSFVMAKAHVAPSKAQTIPRLELEGAVEGLKLAINICQELRLKIQDVLFRGRSSAVWSDFVL
jgi:DNA-binding XRE family transcriptional regulator